jgi:hypothetical protein
MGATQHTINVQPDRSLRIRVVIGGEELSALVDTGAGVSLIASRSLPAELQPDITQEPAQMRTVKNGDTFKTCGSVRTTIRIQQQQFPILLHITNDIKEDLILGHPWLRRTEAVLDYPQGTISLGTTERITVSWTHRPKPELPWQPPTNLQQDFPPRLQQEFHQILRDHWEVFAAHMTPGKTRTVTHHIKLKGPLPRCPPAYRYSEEKRRLIEDQVQEMLEGGIIEQSVSPYASPVVIVKKKDSTPRFCVDNRRLNQVTEEVVQPMVNIHDALRDLGTAKIFSTLDLNPNTGKVSLSDSSHHIFKKIYYVSEMSAWSKFMASSNCIFSMNFSNLNFFKN